MAELLFQYSAGTAFASAVIRRLTHSRFSHVDILIPGEGLLGVSGPDCATPRGVRFRARLGMTHDIGGVQLRPFNPWPYASQPLVARAQTTEDVVRRSIEYARSQIGTPFDNNALYYFLKDRVGAPVKGRDWRDPEQWFCSEFAIRVPEVGGLFPYQLVVTKDVVSPNDSLLLLNPYLTEQNIYEFLE